MSFDLDSLLFLASKTPSMDLWLVEGRVPFFNGAGKIGPVAGCESIPPDAVRQALLSRLDSKALQAWETLGHCRFRLSRGQGLVFRVDLSREASGTIAVFRHVASSLPSLDSLRVPPSIRNLLGIRSGIVLFVGPGKSGITTLSSSFAAALCQQQALKVRILDPDPEWMIPMGTSFVVRGVPQAGISEDIHSSLRSGMELFVMGDIEPGDLSHALKACSGAGLVIANLRASSSIHAIERISNESSQLFRSLRAIVCCHLLPGLNGEELVPVWDILLINRAVLQALESGEMQKVLQLQKAGSAEGMLYLDDSLSLLVGQGKIHKQDAKSRAHEAQLFE